ncbi:MAG: flagellar hook-basal body protein [Bacillota bacterium]|jgi:flagellar basal body rod protein FlgG
MINSFYTAKIGATNYQSLLDVSANNLANASTTGFKSQRIAYSDLVYTNMPAQKYSQNLPLQVGHGAKVNSISANLEQGAVQETGHNLDVAILGAGYFCVERETGQRYYTRAGNFRMVNSGEEKYLITCNGERVLDDKFQPITIKEPGNQVILYGPAEGESAENTIRLAVVNFDNPYALREVGSGLLAATDQSGEGTLVSEARLRQGALECSNVDLATEITKILQAQRGFQFSARIIQTADEIEAMANTLRS